jgi:predicted metal-dependent HD superfamily phosphohydrolase
MPTLKEAFHSTLQRYDVVEPERERLWQEVEQAHSAKGRHYHTLAHLEHLHAELEAAREQATDTDALVLATAYHDLIYSVTRHDNEARSAERMHERLAPLGLPEPLLRSIHGHIRATQAHHASNDPDTDLFTDADMSILGAAPERYQAYAAQVRREYRRYPDLLYRPGRRKVLKHFLAMPRIYKTPWFQDRYGAAAIRNLGEELRALGGA